MASTDRDDEGFPPCGPDNELDTYIDEFEVTYVCENVAGLGWVGGRSDVQRGLWRTGRSDVRRI